MKIVDYDAFYANVYNKMSPEELVNSLSERGSFSNIHGSTTKGTQCIMRVQSNEKMEILVFRYLLYYCNFRCMFLLLQGLQATEY